MAKTINTVKGREGLRVRKEPHWLHLRRGCAIGFRKMTASGEGTWLVKYRESGNLRREETTLGDFAQVAPGERYGAALEAAERWLAHMGAGGSNKAGTVADACKAYVSHLKGEGRPLPANDAEGRFKRWVYESPLGKIELQKLTRPKVLDWRRDLVKTKTLPHDKDKKGERKDRSAASVNRDMTALRAALNVALAEGRVTADSAWRVPLRPIAGANGRRNTYLSPEQRRDLIKSAQPDIQPFLRGLCSLPLRPGALASLTAGDFDRQLKVLRIGKDKNGKARQIPLPPSTAALFAEQVKDKLPAAPLFTRGNGMAWNKDAWKDPVSEAVAGAELPEGTTAYTLRHSTITDLVALHGLDLMNVAILADTSIAMIQKHYGHLNGERAIEALGKLAV